MTVQKPEAFKRTVAQSFARIKTLYAELPAQYASAYEASLRPRVGETAGKVTASDVSDPTGEVGFDHPAIRRPTPHASIRRALERCEVHMADAESALKAAEREILLAMGKLDPRETMNVEMWDHQGPGPAELARLHEAQARRRAAGEVV